MRDTANASPAEPTSAMFTKKRRRSATTVLLAAAIALILALPAFASADPLGTVTEYTSVGMQPNKNFLGSVAQGPDGNLWFAEAQLGIGRITPSGTITEFNTGLNAGAVVMAIAAGPDGNLWFTDAGATRAIGRITPSGTITEFSSGLKAGAVPVAIVEGSDGNLWFTDNGTTKAIGRITPSGEITEFSEGFNAGSKPGGIAAGSDGNLWFTDNGTTKAIGRIDPTNPEAGVEEFSEGLNAGSVPGGGGAQDTSNGFPPLGIAAGSDGNLWFTDNGTTKAIGRITPSGEITEFSSGLQATSKPHGLTSGPDGNLWFTDHTGVNEVQTFEIEGAPTGGTLKLSFDGQTTGATGEGKLAAESKTVTEVSTATGTFVTGETIEGSGIKPGTTISSCTPAAVSGACIAPTVITLSQATEAIVPGTKTPLTANLKTEPSAVQVVNALKALSTIGTIGANANVSGAKEGTLPGTVTYKVQFVNKLGATDVPQLTCDPSSLTGGSPSCPVATTTSGVTNKIGRITTSGTITEFDTGLVAGGFGGSIQEGITAGSDGNLWFTDLGTAETNGAVRAIGKFGIEPALTLKVTKTGSGSGTVTSSPSGINCGSECSKEFEASEEVALEQVADPGSEFTGWTGCTKEEAGKCIVKISGFNEIEVTADFKETGPTNRRTLTLTKSGPKNSAGTVMSKPKGIKCASTCSKAEASLYKNTVVTLSAKATTGSTFAGWSGGGCSGTGTCVVTLNEAKTVNAEFSGASKEVVNPKVLTVSKVDNGFETGYGTVKATGLTCEADCTETEAAYFGGVTEPKPKAAATATLTAVAALGSEFKAWTGCDEVKEGNCVVSMSAAKSVTAEFIARPTNTLTVLKSGPKNSAGTVMSKPKGIKCASACSSATASYSSDTVVVLSAKATTGSTFAGWSGGGCSGTGTCTVTMSSAKTVTAEFSGASKEVVNPKVLTLTKAGSGYGTVKATGLTCEAACTSTAVAYFGGVTEPKPKAAATVTLTAVAAPGSGPVSWSGCESEPEGNCVVLMSKAQSVTATFNELE